VARPPRSYGQRHEIAEGSSPREAPYHCAEKTGNKLFASLYIFRVVLLLLRQRRGAVGNGLGTTAKCLRLTTSAAAGSSLGITIKYLRQRRGAAGKNLGTTIKYLRCASSGSAGNGLSTMTKYL
jgi:hypothetical protein